MSEIRRHKVAPKPPVIGTCSFEDGIAALRRAEQAHPTDVNLRILMD